MIRLRNIRLPETTKRELEALQRDLDAIADFNQRVEEGKEWFERKNRKDNPVFREVRLILRRMCSGAGRCMYCEDSRAFQIEHVKPKALYPEEIFVWENYLFVCGYCNSAKNDNFAVFSSETGKHVLVKRTVDGRHPVSGKSVLINPRRENPLLFLELDLLNTFHLKPISGTAEKKRIRADYTVDVLNLRDNDVLCAARREAYASYCARLAEYIADTDSGKPKKLLDNRRKALQRMHHPTVWHEMKRRRNDIPELRGLFEQAPEALDW